MAVKFSEFTPEPLVSGVTEVVGYQTSGELNVRIPPANLDTTYEVSTGNAGASPTINLQGTKPSQPAISPTSVSLTGSGATLLNGDGSTTIDFASTVYTLSATDNADPAVNTPLLLDGVGGGDVGTDTINLIGNKINRIDHVDHRILSNMPTNKQKQHPTHNNANKKSIQKQ